MKSVVLSFIRMLLTVDWFHFFLPLGDRMPSVVHEDLANPVRCLSLQEQAVNPLYCHCLLRINHQIPVLATVVAEEPGKGHRDLAVCKPLSLSPFAFF